MPLLPSCKDREIAYYAHSLISLLIMFGCGQLTPIPPLTPLGMNLIGIFLGVLYGWIFIDIIWPSMAGLLALMLIGGMKPNELFQTSFGDPLVMMMFFIFVFCATINYYGLSKFISLWFITRKCVAGKPWLFTYTFFLSIMLLGALTSASPAVVIGWSILYGICDKCGYQKGEGYPTMMVFGIVYAAQIGMSIIPFKQVPFTVLGAYENMSGMTIDYAKYMIIAITCCALCSLLFIVMAKYVFKPDMKKLISLDTGGLDTEGALRLNKVQKIVLGFLFALVVLLLLPNILPATSGMPLLRFKTMVDSGVTWGIILILAVVMPLSHAMANDESGITKFLMALMTPFFGNESSLVFALCMGFFATVLTQFMNNGATGIALMPVVYSYCTGMNVPPELAIIMVVMGVHIAFLTPAASASASLLHGNEWSNTKAIWRTVPIVILATWATISAIVVALGVALF